MHCVNLHPILQWLLLMALLTKYSLKSGGFRVGKLMGTGSFSYLLKIAQFYVTVGSQLGDDVAQSHKVMVIVGETFIM